MNAPAPKRPGRAGLALCGVRIALNGTELVAGLTLAVAPGEVATVMGPSGAGKSSLLSYLCGTLDAAFAAQGEIWVDGREVSRLPVERRRIGILFQDDLLFPHLTVGENLLFAIPREIPGRRARRELVRRALAEAGLPGMEDRDPATLSGGQRARVALMRTLLSRPRAVLLDEPFSRLDAPLKAAIRQFVFDHVRAEGLPTLLVTHDPEDARAAGGPLLQLGPGLRDGREDPGAPAARNREDAP